MTARRAYLDHNASAPLLPVARAAMLAALDAAGNASSVHGEGRSARRLVEAARRDVAALVNANAAHVVFTSGATEAANLLLTGEWTMGRSALRMSALYVCAADHPCVLSGGRFAPADVHVFGVDANGVAAIGDLERLLASHVRNHVDGLPLVAIHAANNETGVVQPIAEIARTVRAAGGVLVVDAVQAAGRIPIDISTDWGDFLILSSHKLGGPQGAGAIVGVADLMMPAPLLRGGGQEKGHRAGTENVAAIAGFGAAAREALVGLADMEAIAGMRETIEASILELIPDAVFHGAGANRLPNTTLFSVPGIKAETAQIAFDLGRVAVSAGAACSSGRVGPSHVLKAMGYDAAEGAIRVSIGRSTTAEEVEMFRAGLARLAATRVGRIKAA